jgi:hypothetical protein
MEEITLEEWNKIERDERAAEQENTMINYLKNIIHFPL